ncbi:type IV secretion protein Rhs [Mucilaginibacter sp. HC2]|uniref:type VI secretion system Vgr family protein n=1 Tax=Mucilaginibacter inviolabilis TaxID=2714892 RepID=UPI0014098225|nr:phage baseplate assembly protein V [Mucilaginibacter inviolabilis]NHA07684.1 type IV secretion protein Rhs [Mucilaginibacter inviolabilis]
MEKKLIVDINIEGTSITHFSTFNLDQRFNEHHTFQLRFNHDQVEEYNQVTLQNSKDFIGKNITVQFGVASGSENIFSGIVTKVELSQSHGFHGDILVSGFSPGILIDRGPDLGSYLNKDLKTIIQLATQDAPQNDLKFSIKPTNTSPIDYLIQYRESDYDFINRLSAEYYEWFYYDGQKLNFGKPDKLEEVSLIYGRDLHSLQYAMQIAPLKQNKFAYIPKQDELLKAEPQGGAGSNPDVSHAISASNKVFSKVFNGPMEVRVNSQKEISDFVNNEQKAQIAELVNIIGNGDNPQVGLGKVLNVSTSMRGATSFELQDFGKFLVTAVYHQIDGVGHYQNTFEGVTADTERLPVNEAAKPNPDMQLADVTDNNDPNKQGRIKVKFKWQCQSNDDTEWLRVVSPNAGSGDTGKNRGFLVVPEKGDQVIIAFEEGNIARPVVMGSVYHSNNVDSGGFTDSNIKGMTSRKGSHLQFNDAEHALALATSGANMLHVHEGQGLVQTTAKKIIAHQTGQNAMVMNSDEGLIGVSALKKIIHETGGNGVEIENQNGSIIISAKQSITIQCGNSKITLTPEQIVIDSKNTFIN